MRVGRRRDPPAGDSERHPGFKNPSPPHDDVHLIGIGQIIDCMRRTYFSMAAVSPCRIRRNV